ncbi:MAG: DUF6230 family protein [Sporichthyaceae bacterium]
MTPEYGTRWRVVGAVLAPTLAVVAALGLAMAKGALAVSLVAQSGSTELVAGGVTGEGFGVAVVDVPVGSKNTPGARIGIAAGRIDGLCLAHRVQLLGKPFTLLISGGDGNSATHEIVANRLILDVLDVRADIAAGGEVQLNENAADVLTGRVDLGGRRDRFGLESQTVRLREVRAAVRDIVVPDLRDVPNFRMEVVAGDRSCPAPN